MSVNNHPIYVSLGPSVALARASIDAAGTGADSGDVQIQGATWTSGTHTALSVNAGTNTGVTASTEVPDVEFDLGRVVTWATGALTDQRVIKVSAPTLAFVAASTVTNAATLYLNRAPIAGTNATITNSYAFWVDADTARFDGVVVQNAIPRIQSTSDTTGSPTISTPMGVVRVASGATSVTVTCAACTTATLITGAIRNVTSNACYLRSIVPGAGSFVVTVSADPGASHADIVVSIAQPGSGV